MRRPAVVGLIFPHREYRRMYIGDKSMRDGYTIPVYAPAVPWRASRYSPTVSAAWTTRLICSMYTPVERRTTSASTPSSTSIARMWQSVSNTHFPHASWILLWFSNAKCWTYRTLSAASVLTANNPSAESPAICIGLPWMYVGMLRVVSSASGVPVTLTTAYSNTWVADPRVRANKMCLPATNGGHLAALLNCDNGKMPTV